MKLEQLREKAHELPLEPGVYIMKDSSGEIIYVGKAKALRNRVSQYFAALESHSPKTRTMVSHIDDFETIFAKTEFDALLLENTLIKKHKPKYNILLKDDKGYPFLRLGREDYARFGIVSKRKNDGAVYFGPYGGRGSANSVIRLLGELFLFPNCGRKFPRDIGRDRPCLRLDLGKCCGVCTGEVSAEQYGELLHQACLLLEGKCGDLEQRLGREMEACAENLEFERAASLRDRLKTVRSLQSSTVVQTSTGADMDVIACAFLNARACVTVLSYMGGILTGKYSAVFGGFEQGDAADILESFIKQFYGSMAPPPKEVCLSHPVEAQEALEQYLSALKDGRCRIKYPQRGSGLERVRLAEENGRLELMETEAREARTGKSMDMLREMLSLEKAPQRIESYDISNTAGTDPVASMVVLQSGKLLKGAYKRFKVKTVRGGDDTGAMSEVVGRRLAHAAEGTESFLPLPDLILVDGAAAQAAAAEEQVKKYGFAIPVFGMVKDSRHRTRALISSGGKEIGLTAAPAVFAMVGRLQEEVHRFAVEYHHKVREKTVRGSELDNIPGVGETRRRALLKRFGSVRAIAAASEEELMQAVPKNVAAAVKKYFTEKRNENNNGKSKGQTAGDS